MRHWRKPGKRLHTRIKFYPRGKAGRIAITCFAKALVAANCGTMFCFMLLTSGNYIFHISSPVNNGVHDGWCEAFICCNDHGNRNDGRASFAANTISAGVQTAKSTEFGKVNTSTHSVRMPKNV